MDKVYRVLHKERGDNLVLKSCHQDVSYSVTATCCMRDKTDLISSRFLCSEMLRTYKNCNCPQLNDASSDANKAVF